MATTVTPSASDIPQGNWVDRFAPAPWRPYMRLMRLDRPIGTWLLLFPCWWSIALATPGVPSLWLFVLFGLGAVIMRGAGCTLNDLADRDFDAMVARTADRPIPSGDVSPMRAGLFLVLLLLAGAVILFQFNRFAIIVGIASLALVGCYPFAKRVTNWPQAILGLTFNWGALLGWAAVRGDLGMPALALYVGGLFWTLGYDTIYAHQDKEDDAIVGVRSSALRLGEHTRPWLFIFYGLALFLFGLAGHAAGLHWVFFIGLGVAGLHLAWQAATIDIDDPKACLAAFKSHRDFSTVLLAAIMIGQVLR